MTNRKSTLSKCNGFTIAELLIAAIIAMFAISAGFELVINQNKNHLIQAGISDMQQNGRSGIDELTATIRQAGYRVPLGVICMASDDTNPDTVQVGYLDEPLCSCTVATNMAQPTSIIEVNHDQIDCFGAGSYAYIYDPAATTGEYFEVTQVSTGSKLIYHDATPLSKSYSKGARVFVMRFTKYYVDDSDSLHPRMMKEEVGLVPEIYVDNIQDLQFRYVQASGAVQNVITSDRLVREVKIDLVARTDKIDLFENGYRVDTLSTTVMIRNLDM